MQLNGGFMSAIEQSELAALVREIQQRLTPLVLQQPQKQGEVLLVQYFRKLQW